MRFLIVLLLMSCGTSTALRTNKAPKQTEVPIGQEDQADPFGRYVSGFEALSGLRVTTPIEFVSSLEVANALAVCRISIDDVRIIQAVESTFKELEAQNPKQAEYIIFHELGHCELGRPHTTQHLKDYPELPYSMMFPSFPESFASFLRLQDHYYEELIGLPLLQPDSPFAGFLVDKFKGTCYFKMK